MDERYSRAMLDSNWSSICRRFEVHLEGMSTDWCQEVYPIVAEKVREFMSLPAPKSNGELQNRFSQEMGLSSIVACVSHIEMMLERYPQRKDDRIRLAKAACSSKLPTNRKESGELHAGRMAISMEVSSISFDEMAMAQRR